MPLTAEFDRAFRLHQQGKLREAYLRYEAILQADPKHAGALHYSGVVLFQAGKLPEAIGRIREAIAVDASSAEAWSNLALALDGVGRSEAALNAYREAARRAPQSADVWSNLAAAEFAASHAPEAEAAARKAVAIDPQHPASWFNLAHALAGQSRVLEALDAATRAAGAGPDVAAYAGLKAQLEDGLDRVDPARRTLETALARHPTAPGLRFQLAELLERRFDAGAAADAYAQVLKVEPDHVAALGQLLFLRQRLGDWHDLPALRAQLDAAIAAGKPLASPFVLLSQPTTRAQQKRATATWVAAAIPERRPPTRQLLSSGRLRIGYLSGDFHTHATAFLAAGLFEAHDRARFEVVGYSTGPDDRSPMRARLVKAFDRFVDARGRTPQELAARITGDGIDLLVDLKGHTEGSPLPVLALRPAPIQAHYLGYPGTIGGGLVDYLIGDPVVTPVDELDDYLECVALLPGCYQVNDRLRPIVEPPPRAALGLPDAAVVFCCFNGTFKLNPEVFDAWARILARVPDGVLWLLARGDDDPAIANLRREAATRGIDPGRLVFATARPNADYLGLYRHADLFLDTWPYNAHTTGSDALWAGCPLLTWRGETFAARVAASLLAAVGLPELIATDVDDYVTRAVDLALDPERRRALRAHLAGPGRASPLFDTVGTTRALEAAYLSMAEQYRRQRRTSFRIEAET